MYTHFAPYYDLVQGTTPVSFARWIEKEVQRLDLEVRSVLELGSGTGAVLEHLPSAWQKFGVDTSAAMIAEASRKDINAELVLGDLRSVRMGRTFDVVACVYDTVNHLQPSDWVAAFRTAAAHLAPGGVFLFDVNTLGRLRRGSTEPAFVIDSETVSGSIQIAQRSIDEFVWTIRIESNVLGHDQEVVESVTEYARPLIEVQGELTDAGFSSVHVSAGRGRAVDDDAPRLFFTCQQ